MATHQTIRDELETLAVLLQHSISQSDLEVIALEWADTFRNMPESDLRAALKEHRSRSQFWPKEVEILRIHDDLVAARRRGVLALPEAEMSEEEARRAEICRLMVRQFGFRDEQVKKFFSLTDRREKDALAREMLGARYPEACNEQA